MPSRTTTTEERSRLPWTAVAASAVLALAAAVAVYVVLDDGSSTGRAVEDPGNGLTLADAPEVSEDVLTLPVERFDGSTTQLSEFLDEPLVVNFFASTCAPCIHEMPAFEEVSREVGDEVSFVGLAVADRPSAAQGIVEETGVTYPTAQDKSGEVLQAFGGIGMPTTAWVAPNGTVLDVHTGALDADELRERLSELFGVEA